MSSIKEAYDDSGDSDSEVVAAGPRRRAFTSLAAIIATSSGITFIELMSIGLATAVLTNGRHRHPPPARTGRDVPDAGGELVGTALAAPLTPPPPGSGTPSMPTIRAASSVRDRMESLR